MAALAGSIQLLKKTTAELAAAPYDTYIVKDGQFVIELTDTDKYYIKSGNGVDVYSDLPYLNVSPAIENVINYILRDNLILESAFSYNGTGLEYTSYIKGIINGEEYEAAPTVITLSNGGAQDRIDVIALQNDNTVVVIEGTESANPVKPTVDTATQVEDRFVLVTAGSTEPGTPPTDEIIFSENAEWTFSSTTATVEVNSTSPIAGSFDIKGTAMPSGSYFELTIPSGTIALSDYSSLSFDILIPNAWGNNRGLIATWYNDATPVGSISILNGNYGLNTSDNTVQSIVVPVSEEAPVTKIRFSRGGSQTIDFSIDRIRLQSEASSGVNLSNYYTKAETDALLAALDYYTQSQVNTLLATKLSIANLDTARSWTTPQRQTPQALTDGATITWDISTKQDVHFTLGGNRTLAITNLAAGIANQKGVIYVYYSGAYTLTLPASCRTPNGAGLEFTSTVGAVDIISYSVDPTGTYVDLSLQPNFS